MFHTKNIVKKIVCILYIFLKNFKKLILLGREFSALKYG